MHSMWCCVVFLWTARLEDQDIKGYQYHFFCYSSPTSYVTMLAVTDIPSLQARSLDDSKHYFTNICQPNSCSYHLFPPPRDPAVTSHLRGQLYTQGQAFAIKDINLQCLNTAFQIFSNSLSNLHSLKYALLQFYCCINTTFVMFQYDFTLYFSVHLCSIVQL